MSNEGTAAVEIDDLRLVATWRPEMATFIMGLGAVSGYRPDNITWPWSALGAISPYQNESVKKWGPMNPGDAVSQAWIGRVEAGMRIALKGLDPAWQSPEDYPKSLAALGMTDWSNCLKPLGSEPLNRTFCKGVVAVEAVDAGVRFSASLGEVTMAPSESKDLAFDILITPLKAVNLTQHFSTRYWHFGGWVHTQSESEVACCDVNVFGPFLRDCL